MPGSVTESFRYAGRKYKRLAGIFYEGPSWLRCGRVGERKKYISPSFMLLCWCRGVLNRVFTFQGWMLFWVCLATGFYATIMIRSAVTILFLILAGLFLFNILILFLLLPRLKVTRKIPGSVVPGKTFAIAYEIENLSPFPCFSIVVDPLLAGKGVLGELPPCFSLAGKEKKVCVRYFQVDERGVWLFPSATVESSFPFGLVKASFCDHKSVTVLAHPVWRKWQHPHLLTNKGNERGLLQKMSRKSTFQRGMDVAGCREYVYGDELHLIHWGNSAKWGKLVVKEFEEEKSCRIGIILDTGEFFSGKELYQKIKDIFLLRSFREEKGENKFESILSFASSMAASFPAEEFELDFYFPVPAERVEVNGGGKGRKFFEKWILGKEEEEKNVAVKRIRTGSKNMSLEHFNDFLAAMKKVRKKERFVGFTPEILQEIGENPYVIFVVSHLDESVKNLAEKIREKGISCRILHVMRSGEKEEKEKEMEAEKIKIGPLLSGKWMK